MTRTPLTRSVRSPSRRLNPASAKPARCEKTPLAFQSSKSGTEAGNWCQPRAAFSVQHHDHAVRVRNRQRRQHRARTLKIAVFAPMPRASVSTATAAKPGRVTSIRNPKRKS